MSASRSLLDRGGCDPGVLSRLTSNPFPPPLHRYWLMGNCLAGDTCVFSHDPSSLINKLSFEDPAVFGDGSPPPHHVRPNFQIQDYNSFPALQQFGSSQFAAGSHRNGLGQAGCSTSAYDGGHQLGTSPGALAHPNLLGDAATRRPRSRSRPASRHSRAATPSIPSVDDPDAFPSLGASGAGSGKKKNNNNNNNNNNHGRRSGHGNGNGNGNGNGPKDKEMSPTMAGVLRMAPSPKPGQGRPTSKAGKRGSSGARENGAAAQRIPAPQHIPWLETGDRADKAYLKARQEAIKHGALRNKFLQRWVWFGCEGLLPVLDVDVLIQRLGVQRRTGLAPQRRSRRQGAEPSGPERERTHAQSTPRGGPSAAR